MRVINDGHEWYFKRATGKVRLSHCDSENGRMVIVGKAMIQGDAVYFYPPKDETVGTPVGARLPESHWRLCYRRANRDWRLRNERTGDLTMVNGYVGDLNLDWQDGGSHVFHDGAVVLDEDKVAHFV